MRQPEIAWLHSPNFASRRGAAVSLLVLHYTGMQSAEEAIARLRNVKAQVSAHYVIDEQGRIFQLVDEEHAAWHAGVSNWRGISNINSISVGVEIVNPGHEWGYRPFPKEQMESVAQLCADIVMRHAIQPGNVVAHSDVAPQRKQDPGERFDWKFLASRGVGVWPELESNAASGTPQLAMGDTGEEVRYMQETLAQYGYEVAQDGLFGEATRNVVTAFQRQYRQHDISGKWDGECAALLKKLREG